MANKEWYDATIISDDCLSTASWLDMVEYIQHSMCLDVTFYTTCTSTGEAFKFTANTIAIAGDRAVYINDDEVYLGHGAGDNIVTGDGIGNTLLGHDAGNDLTVGDYNVAVGFEALDNPTDVDLCVAVGRHALADNIQDNIVGIGAYALQSNTGIQNTAIGHTALSGACGGHYNTAIGYQAGLANTNGYRNTFIGGDAGVGNTTGYQNVYVGQTAGASLADGERNTFLGFAAGTSNTANNIVGIGYQALQNNTGTENTAVGYQALAGACIDDQNAAFGYQSLLANTGGKRNCGMGNYTLLANTTGNYNTAVGIGAGQAATATIHGCVYLGYHAGYVNTVLNTLYINNEGSAYPLIWGDFANDILKLGNNDNGFFFKFSFDANDSIVESEATDRSIYLKPHGTGLVKFGTYAAKGAEEFAGYITMEDSGGTPRKVMVCA